MKQHIFNLINSNSENATFASKEKYLNEIRLYFNDINLIISNEYIKRYPLHLFFLQKQRLYLIEKRNLQIINIKYPFDILLNDTYTNSLAYLSFNNYLSYEFFQNAPKPIAYQEDLYYFLNKYGKKYLKLNKNTISEDEIINFENFQRLFPLPDDLMNEYLRNYEQSRSSKYIKRILIENHLWANYNTTHVDIDEYETFSNINGEKCSIKDAFWQGNPYYQLIGNEFQNWYKEKIQNLNDKQKIVLLHLFINDYDYIKNKVLNPLNYEDSNIHPKHFESLERFFFNDAQKKYFKTELLKLESLSVETINEEKSEFEVLAMSLGEFQKNGKFFLYKNKYSPQYITKCLIAVYNKYYKDKISINSKNNKVNNYSDFSREINNYFVFPTKDGLYTTLRKQNYLDNIKLENDYSINNFYKDIETYHWAIEKAKMLQNAL